VIAGSTNSKIGASLLLLAIFTLGAVAGVVSHSLYVNHEAAAAAKTVPQTRNIVEDLARNLKLDGAQKQQLKVILDQSREKYRALSHEFRPRYEVIRNETNEQIRKILHDEQKARFEEFVRNLDQRHKGHNSHSGY
jgi:Spy/CpxP family protein refolding chaperone